MLKQREHMQKKKHAILGMKDYHHNTLSQTFAMKKAKQKCEFNAFLGDTYRSSFSLYNLCSSVLDLRRQFRYLLISKSNFRSDLNYEDPF